MAKQFVVEKNKAKQQVKSERPRRGRRNTVPSGASDTPGTGGSRQGNIGHQAGDQNDNSHR